MDKSTCVTGASVMEPAGAGAITYAVGTGTSLSNSEPVLQAVQVEAASANSADLNEVFITA
jgi:hypothetical protein